MGTCPCHPAGPGPPLRSLWRRRRMSADPDGKLESLGFPLDRIPGVGAIYKPVVIDGTTVYTSGNVPFDGDQLVGVGKVPTDVSIEEGKRFAALCAANILR